MKKMTSLLSFLVVVFLAVIVAAAGVMASPPMPDDLNIVQPDSALPKELAAFSGKWESTFNKIEFFAIVEKISEETAILYLWSSMQGWQRLEAKVAKAYGKWQIWFSGRSGKNELSLRKGEKYLDLYAPMGTITFTRVP